MIEPGVLGFTLFAALAALAVSWAALSTADRAREARTLPRCFGELSTVLSPQHAAEADCDRCRCVGSCRRLAIRINAIERTLDRHGIYE